MLFSWLYWGNGYWRRSRLTLSISCPSPKEQRWIFISLIISISPAPRTVLGTEEWLHKYLLNKWIGSKIKIYGSLGQNAFPILDSSLIKASGIQPLGIKPMGSIAGPTFTSFSNVFLKWSSWERCIKMYNSFTLNYWALLSSVRINHSFLSTPHLLMP